MKFIYSLTAGLLSASFASAAISTDGSCGGTSKYTCQGSSYGNCCSQYGWCGSSDAHCKAGCNTAFGTCTGSTPTTMKSSTKPAPTSTRTSAAPSSTPTNKVSTDATCGSNNGGATCLGSTFGNCCSGSGWCGSTSDYCGSTCQSGFGNCGSNNPTGTSSTKPATPTATGGVLQCLNGKNVPYKMTSDSDYSELVEPYNLARPFKPSVVVLPQTQQNVQDAVVCAAQNGIKVQAKSGGHSYASFSSGGKDGAMMISLQPFQKVELDTSTGITKVGGGVRLGNLADGIYTQGQKALSHGTCPGVGIGGHFTHGGYGHTSRHWGLAMDQIIAADVVLADGSLIKASTTENSDVFWGIRGAADSIGIVTNFYLQTQAAPSSITYFAFPFSNMYDSKTVFTNAWLHLQDFAKNASVVDNKISFGVYMDNYGTFSLSGAYFGSVDDFNTKVKPELIRTMPAGGAPTVKAYGWYDYLVLVSGKTQIKEPLSGYDEHENFFAKSITVPESTGLTANALNAWFDYIKGATTEYYTIVNLYGGPGSAINSKDTNFAAYNDRDSLWVFQNYGYETSSTNFINGLNDAIIKAQPQTSFGAYLNYVDPSYDAATAHKLYYGDSLYARLLTLKKKVDPNSVFWNPQAIGA